MAALAEQAETLKLPAWPISRWDIKQRIRDEGDCGMVAGADVGWQGLATMHAIHCERDAIQKTVAQLTAEAADVEAEIVRLSRTLEEHAPQHEVGEALGGAGQDKPDLAFIKAQLARAVRKAGAVHRRRMVNHADADDAYKVSSITTPANELRPSAAALWEEVRNLRDVAVKDHQALQMQFDACLAQMENTAREMGKVLARLMLMDDELVDNCFDTTAAHRTFMLALPDMPSLEMRIKAAFLEAPRAFNPHFMNLRSHGGAGSAGTQSTPPARLSVLPQVRPESRGR